MQDSKVSDRPVMSWTSMPDGQGGYVLAASWTVASARPLMSTHVHAA